MSEFTPVTPPADGLRQALVEARGRRYRSAGVSTTSIAAGLILAVSLAGVQAQQSLIQQPAPEQPAVTQLIPVAPEQRRQTTSNEVRRGVAPAGEAAVSQGAPTGPGQATAPDAGSRAPAPAPPYSAGPLTRQDESYGVPIPTCSVEEARPEEASTLCPSSSTREDGTGKVEFYADVCSTRTARSPLTYPGRNEVDFSVYQGSREVWRWSRWHRDGGAAHTLMVATGACVSWQFNWTRVDATGTALPKGRYTLRTTFLAEELAQRRVHTTDFTLD